MSIPFGAIPTSLLVLAENILLLLGYTMHLGIMSGGPDAISQAEKQSPPDL